MDRKIVPPLQRGERRQPLMTIKAYKSTVGILDGLVEQGNTSRVEYLRWLMECAKAGLVGPVSSELFLKDADDLVTGLRSGQMTQLEGLAAVERIARRAALDALDEWTKKECEQ